MCGGGDGGVFVVVDCGGVCVGVYAGGCGGGGFVVVDCSVCGSGGLCAGVGVWCWICCC